MNNTSLRNVAILVVEDDPGIVKLLRKFLESSGAKVKVEQSGEFVIQTVDSFCPDIIILDVVLPYKDGFTILEQLRNNSSVVPVIMLTDRSTIDEKVKGLSAGADDYMTKPFSTKELSARIQTVLRRITDGKNNSARTDISIGTIRVDAKAREIILEDEEKLLLTKTEFDLVLFLAERKLQVVEHNVLLRDVLGYSSGVETKALVMHVANIRKKFARAALLDVKIKTVAGVGYKLGCV